MIERQDPSRNEKAEEAYAVWSTEAAGDTAKTADLTGIPRSTIQRYMREDDWHGRLQNERFADKRVAVETAVGMVQEAMPAVVARMISIVTGTKPRTNAKGELIRDDQGKIIHDPLADNKDAVSAARWLMQYGMMSAYDILTDGASRALPMDQAYGAGGVSLPQNPSERARDIINAQFAENNTRTAKRR